MTVVYVRPHVRVSVRAYSPHEVLHYKGLRWCWERKIQKKKILVIIISRNQCNKHHTRDFQILTQAIVFPAESTRPIYSGLFYCYCDIWHCGPYCTVPYIVPCLHCATFQRHTVMHKRLKLRGPYFLCKMPSILSIWLYFKGFFNYVGG